MTDQRTIDNPCAGCIYEDCYPGICTACETACEKSALHQLSDLVSANCNGITIYHLSFSLGASPTPLPLANTQYRGGRGRVLRG